MTGVALAGLAAPEVAAAEIVRTDFRMLENVMTESLWDRFREIWVCDTEFVALPGECPRPVCLVAREFRSGRVVRLWADEMASMKAAPFDTGKNSLIVAYYASAEQGVFLANGWPLPERVLDLYAEFRVHTNGKRTIGSNGLIGAMSYFGLKAMDAEDKDSNRSLILRGGPWSAEERNRILDYCQADVDGTADLLTKMIPVIDLARGVGLRGRYAKALAQMERSGIPIDVPTLDRIKANWAGLQHRMIDDVAATVPVYADRRFHERSFSHWLAQNGIPWSRHESGRLVLDRKTFREMARLHPGVALLHELREGLSQLRLGEIPVGSDGRNRVLLSPFRSKTGRNQPSNARFIFGTATWLRSLIVPPPGRFIAYVDWTSQEIGIAAKLADDSNLLAAYDDDPYLWFAKRVGAVPADATKKSHKAQRDLYKATMLGVGYGMGERSLAMRIGQPEAKARSLLLQHRETFPALWSWMNGAVNHALLTGWIVARFGWAYHVGDGPNPRSLQNWPVQSNAAEMMRLAACMLTEAGIDVCCPVHDAFLIEGPADQAEEVIARTQEIMAEASAITLDGFRLRSDAKIVMPGERYHDDRGREFFERILRNLEDV